MLFDVVEECFNDPRPALRFLVVRRVPCVGNHLDLRVCQQVRRMFDQSRWKQAVALSDDEQRRDSVCGQSLMVDALPTERTRKGCSSTHRLAHDYRFFDV